MKHYRQPTSVRRNRFNPPKKLCTSGKSKRSNGSDDVTQIFEEETNGATRKSKNEKPPGPDTISNDLLRNGKDKLTSALHKYFNKIMEIERVPQ